MILFKEIAKRFPEIEGKIQDGDEELPYMLMNYVADWINEMPRKQLTSGIISRVVEFSKWCEEQPRGKDAGDDIYTIFIVGFLKIYFGQILVAQ